MANYKPKTCTICGKEFTPKGPTATTCSTECRAERVRRTSRQWNQDHPERRRKQRERERKRKQPLNPPRPKKPKQPPAPKPTIACKQCGALHIQRRKGSIYCSAACAKKASSIRRAEHRAEISRQWRKNNAERAHAAAKAYRKANRPSEAERQRRWRKSPYGKEAYKAAIRKWTLANPELASGMLLRRAKAEAEGNATPELIAAKWEASDKTCCLCAKLIDDTLQSPDPMSFSLEHLTPISRGGRRDIDNIGFAHRVCNSSKGNRTLEEFRERLK